MRDIASAPVVVDGCENVAAWTPGIDPITDSPGMPTGCQNVSFLLCARWISAQSQPVVQSLGVTGQTS
jgi:hypothetical protein